MAETAATSWWIKVGVLYDKSGFKGVVAGMLDINKAAGALYDTFKKVVDVNSDMYNTARYLNVTTDDLQRWERAFRLVGGSVEDARGAIASLNFVYDKLRLGMDSGAAEIGARLGLSPEDFLSFDRMLTALNKSYNELFQSDYGSFKVLAEQLGLSESAMLLVTQSTRDFQQTLRRSSNIPFIPEHQLKAARELDKQFTELSIKWENFKASLISTSLPGLEKVFSRIGEVLSNPETMKRMQDFFQELERGFNELATDENINALVENLGIIMKGFSYVAKGAGWTLGKFKSGVEGVASEVGDLVGEHERGGIDWKNRLAAPLYMFKSPASIPAVSGESTRAVTVNQNITIDGAQNPRAVASEVAGATKRAISNGNANMRAVDNARNRTAL